MSPNKFSLLVIPAAKNIREVVKKFPFPIHLTKGSYKDIAFVFKNKTVRILHKGVDLRSFSFVWLSSFWGSRDLAFAIHLYLDTFSIPHTYVEPGSSKITDCMFFGLNTLPLPDTLFVHRSRIPKTLPLIKEICGYPLIVKDTKGSKGKFSELVSSESEILEKVCHLPKSKQFFFQRFIPNDYDWGIMVANGTIVSGEKSYPLAGEFRNNSCNGAREEFVEISHISENIRKMALSINTLLGLSWCRVDIIVDKNTNLPYLLEVNRFPGITSKSSEVFGAYTFLKSHLDNRLNLYPFE